MNNKSSLFRKSTEEFNGFKNQVYMRGHRTSREKVQVGNLFSKIKFVLSYKRITGQDRKVIVILNWSQMCIDK